MTLKCLTRKTCTPRLLRGTSCWVTRRKSGLAFGWSVVQSRLRHSISEFGLISLVFRDIKESCWVSWRVESIRTLQFSPSLSLSPLSQLMTTWSWESGNAARGTYVGKVKAACEKPRLRQDDSGEESIIITKKKKVKYLSRRHCLPYTGHTKQKELQPRRWIYKATGQPAVN